MTRIAGDDRYETAEKVAALALITSGTDTMVLVNGTSTADAVAAGFIAAKKGWPMVLLPGSATGAGADAIDTYLALPGSAASFLIVGGPAVMPSSIDEYLIGEGVSAKDIRRVGGADRYHTSLLLNVHALTEGYFDGSKLALVSGEAPWDALASAGWAAVNGVHVQLTPTAGGNVFVATLASTLASLNLDATGTIQALTGISGYSGPVTKLFVIGGKAAVSEAARTGAMAAFATDLTSSLSGCTEGATSFTLSFSKRLSSTERGNMTRAVVAPLIELNGVALETADIAANYPAEIADGVYSIKLASTVLDEDDELEFATQVEGLSTISNSRSILGSTCEVVADTTGPSVSIRILNGEVDGGATDSDQVAFLVTSNEPLKTPSLVAGSVTVATSTPTSNDTALVATEVGSGGKTWILTAAAGEGELDGLAVANAGVAVTFDKSGFKDLNDNNPSLNVTVGIGLDDETAPVLSVASVKCAAVAGSNYAKMTAGNLVVTAKNYSTLGVNGNAYTLVVVNQRGLVSPTVSISDAKVITVTADIGYHKPNDVKTAFQNAWLENPLLGDWVVTAGTGALTATVAPARSTTGKSECVVTITSNEPFTMGDATTVAVNGIAQTMSFAATTPAADYSNLTTGMLTARVVTVTTSQVGTGVFTFATGNTGVNDMKGNDLATNLTFTVS